MGTINYQTCDFITMAIRPYDFNDIKAEYSEEYNNHPELAELTDDIVYDYISDYEEQDKENALEIIENYSFSWFSLDIAPGYYEGLQILLDTDFDFYDGEDKADALNETDNLRQCLIDLAGVGFISCSPFWCTSYRDYDGTIKDIEQAISDIKKAIEETLTFEEEQEKKGA